MSNEGFCILFRRQDIESQYQEIATSLRSSQ